MGEWERCVRTAPVGETAPAITFDATAPVPPTRLALKTGSRPVVSKLVKKGSVTWSATGWVC